MRDEPTGLEPIGHPLTLHELFESWETHLTDNGRFLRHRFSPKPKVVATTFSLPKRNRVAKEAVSAAWQTKTRQRSKRRGKPNDAPKAKPRPCVKTMLCDVGYAIRKWLWKLHVAHRHFRRCLARFWLRHRQTVEDVPLWSLESWRERIPTFARLRGHETETQLICCEVETTYRAHQRMEVRAICQSYSRRFRRRRIACAYRGSIQATLVDQRSSSCLIESHNGRFLRHRPERSTRCLN